jgi:hypothetical protein
MALAPLSQIVILTEDGTIVPATVQVPIPPPIVLPTVENTPSNSSMLPTQVAGAHDLYVAREAAMDDRERRIAALENA